MANILAYPQHWFDFFCAFVVKRAKKGKSFSQKKRLGLPNSVALGDVIISGKNITIGANTYFNSGYISCAPEASVEIGSWCAIGYNVSVVAITHDVNIPTGPEAKRPVKKAAIKIGNGVWIGNNVVITPGVTIGNFCVIGANSIVTADIPEGAVAAGVPCTVKRIKEANAIEKHKQIIE